MAQSSTLSYALGTAASWVFASICVIGSVIYFDDIRSVGRHAFGISLPDTVAAARHEPESPVSPSTTPSGSVQLNADPRGHFVTSAEVNGRSIDVMVDTGASIVALTWDDAERAGIYVRPSDFTHRVQTANGNARIAMVTVDSISIGSITVRDVKAAVSEPGKLTTTLLGMTFLGRLSRAEMRRGTLLLEE